jgi:iron complex outermembrane recepter protein
VVTAQRRSQNLRDVPITITAVTAETALSSGITTSKDLELITPGLQFQAKVGNANPFLRGVGTSATGAGNEPPVATYIDGVYIPTMPGAMLSLNNIERIEVLKGPQGTLFGRNATGGLIQVITRRPSDVATGDFSIGYASYNTVNAQAYLSGPIASAVNADLALYYNNQADGWGRNIVTGQDINKQRELSIRSKLLWEFGEGSEITLSADYSTMKGNSSVALRGITGSLPLSRIPFTGGFYDIASDHQPGLDTKTGGVSLLGRFEMSAATFVSTSSYRELESSADFDQDFTAAPNINIILNQKEHHFAQEFQLLSPDSDSKFSWILGAFYFHQQAGFKPINAFGNSLGPARFSNTFNNQQTDSISAFAQGTYEIAPATNLTGGIRYTYDWRELTGYIVTAFGQQPPVRTQNSNRGQPSWRLSIDHKFQDDSLLYASYNRGFKSGVFNTGGGGLTSPALPPEKLDAYEVGYKTQFGPLQVNAAAFYYDYQNIQIIRTDTGLQQLLSADARIYGIDLDASVRIGDNLTLRGGLEALHGEYDSFTPFAVITRPLPTGGNSQTPGSGAGKTIVNTPPFVFNVAADYETTTRAGDFSANITYYYNDGYYPEADNRIRTSNYSLVNAQLSFKPAGTPIELRLWGKNLADARYYLAIVEASLGDSVAVAAPRTVGASLRYEF